MSESASDPAQRIAADPDILVVRNPDEEPGYESGCVGSRFASNGVFKDFENLYLAWTQGRSAEIDRGRSRQHVESLFRRELIVAASTHDVETNIVATAAAAAVISVSADLADGRIRSTASGSLFRYFRPVLDGEIKRLKLGGAAFKAAVQSEQLVQEEKHARRMRGVAHPARHRPPSIDESFAGLFEEASQ